MFFNKIHLVDWAEFTNFASVNKTETVIGLSPHLNHTNLHVMDKENKKPIVYAKDYSDQLYAVIEHVNKKANL